MRLCLTLILGLAALPAAGQSLDCSAAQNQMAINQCTYDDWQIADAELNATYQRLMAVMKDQDAQLYADLRGGPEALREAQRAWITFRDKTCEAEGFAMRGGSAEPMVVGYCLGRLTRERTQHLYRMLEDYAY